ncbi:VirB4 family type IV secretion/conjugal transfer ATPase [Xanthomonas sp. 60]
MIVTLTSVLAVLGTLLLVFLFLQARQAMAAQRLAQHRAKDAGVADLLNYAALVEDGVMVCKSGALCASWLYRGEDAASSTDQQREATSMRLNQALSRLGNGWMIHVDAVRQQAPGYTGEGESSFPDVVTAAIDEERRRLFESMGVMYEGYFVLTVTWYPPALAQRKFVEMMFDDEGRASGDSESTQRLLEHFRRECVSLESRLSSAVQLRRLKGVVTIDESGKRTTHDDLLRWLHNCITGIDQQIRLPDVPIYLDALIGGQELWTGVVPRIGRKYMQVVSIEGFPMESSPGMLDALAELQCQYRWSNRFIFMDLHESVKHLEAYRKKWRQKVRGFFDQVFNTNGGTIDQDALMMVADAEAAIAEVNSGMVAQGYYTSVVVLMDEDREKLENSARQVEKLVNGLGFVARIETINTMDAYLGSLPGHGVENIRRPLLNTMNLADLLPTSTIWPGESKAPCPMYPANAPALMSCVTQGATPFRLNLHVRDVGHSFIFGPIGAGKSTHLCLLAAQLRRYPGMSLYCFDKGLSMYALAAASGGDHYNIGVDEDRLAFCPLQFLETKADRSWALEWIDTMLALNGLQSTAAQRNEISAALNSMHDSGARTLSEFCLTIQDLGVREALEQYTGDGAMGHLLDAEDDSLALSSFTVFEIEELFNMGDRFALPVLLYLFRRIERSLDGRPTAIILDEAWLMLGHPTFQAKIREWLKVLRKSNCLVLMATQSLSDAVNSGILDVILESTATKIFLPNVHARDEEASALYKRMGLNSRQIEILASAVPKRHYYYVSELGRRLYDLALGPVALAFVGVSDRESIATIRALRERHGADWIYEWARLRGFNLHDYGTRK